MAWAIITTYISTYYSTKIDIAIIACTYGDDRLSTNYYNYVLNVCMYSMYLETLGSMNGLLLLLLLLLIVSIILPYVRPDLIHDHLQLGILLLQLSVLPDQCRYCITPSEPARGFQSPSL